MRPELVAEVTFLTWTDDRLLRQVVYQGLREDKPAREVMRPLATDSPHPTVSRVIRLRPTLRPIGRERDAFDQSRHFRHRRHSGRFGRPPRESLARNLRAFWPRGGLRRGAFADRQGRRPAHAGVPLARELDRRGDEIEAYRSDLFKTRYLPQVRGFPAVRQLFERIRANGQRIALASSAKADELANYKKIAGIADLVDEETSADDAERSKPHPDIFEAVLTRLGVTDPSEAIVVGDSPYDAEAAGKIGLRTIGVRCGGFPEPDLRRAGCIAIYRDPADVLTRFSTSVLFLERPPRQKRSLPRPLLIALALAAGVALAFALHRRRA